MLLLYTVAIICAIFLNTYLANYLGFGQMVTTIAFFPMMLFIAIRTIDGKGHLNSHDNKVTIYILILAVIIYLFKISLEQDYFKQILLFLVAPVLISLCFENLTKQEIIILRKIVICFFCVECLIAIVERINHVNFFWQEIEELFTFTEDWDFRSTSLLGHPLTNAMAVAVCMSFFLVSDLKSVTQISLFILGYIALFCFNARGAILTVTFLCVPYLFWRLNKKIKRRKLIINTFVILSFAYLCYFIVQTPLGGRLLNTELIDSSTQTRLDVFDFYLYLDNSNLLWGNPDNYAHIMNMLSAGGVENGVITIILQYGLILSIPLLILLFLFHYQKLAVFSKIERFFLLAIFYLIGIMNPNLASPLHWTLWVFLYYAFRYKKQLIDSPLNYLKQNKNF
jgi:hypothetical protein